MDMPTVESGKFARENTQKQLLDMYRRHHRVILSQICGRVQPQDVEDVLHGVLAAILPRLEQLQGYSETRQAVYVRAMARNAAADYLRSRVRTRQRIADMDDEDMRGIADESDSVEALIVRQDALERMRGAIKRLPVEKRDLLEMKYMQEMDDAQIAARLGIRQENVRQRLHRLRKELRRMMKEDGYE